MNKKIQRLRKKIFKRHTTRYEWCGRLTPAEIIYLIDTIGIKNYSRDDEEWYRDKVTKGESGTFWFYFIPQKKHLEQLGLP